MSKWVNSFSEVEDLGNGRIGMTIYLGHQVFKDKVDGKWKKHKLTPTKNYVLMQSARCCVEVHPYYAVYYDVNHEEVRVYDSRWVVEVWTGKRWKDLGFWNPILAVEEFPNGIKVVREGQTTDGTLKVEFILLDTSPLKHKVTWTNKSTSEKTVRIVLKWAGIVGNKITTVRRKEYAPPITVNDGFFIFGDEQTLNKIGESIRKQFEEGILNPVTIDAHPKGMKADFEFEEFTVAPNDSTVIDPDTYTNSNPTEDGYIRKYDSSYSRDNVSTVVDFFMKKVKTKSGWVTHYYRGYVEWDISAIPDNATINLVKFKYHGRLNDVDDIWIYSMENQPSTSTDSVVWTDAEDGTAYLSGSATFPEVGTNKEVGGAAVPWTVDPKTDLQNRLVDNWFAFGFKNAEKTSDAVDSFYSEEYTETTPKPTLYVEYTVGAPPAAGYAYQDGLVCVMVAG